MQSNSGRVRTLARISAVLVCALTWVISASAQSIIVATYGSGNNRVDVTRQLQSFAGGGQLNVRVNNQTMGVDPAPRQPKDLRVQVRDRSGQVHDFMFREGEIASLMVNPGGADFGRGYNDDEDRRDRDWDRHDRDDRDDLVILKAFYGINNATAEVTGHLRDMVRNNSLVMRVDNAAMGIDPAHDHGKVLCVYYRYRGEQRAAIVRETEQLVIP